MKYICNIICFSTVCSCGITTTITTEQGNVGSQSAGLAGFPFTVMKASLRLEAAAKATLDSAGPGVVTDEEPRVKSGKIQYESKVLQLGLCERSEDRQ